MYIIDHFRCFSSKIKSMKKLLSNETFPTLFDIDSSFHTAFSMEARSRSPLPLSLTSIHNIEHNTPTKPDSNIILTNKLKPMSRPIPTKPPRKNIPLKEDNSRQLYEAVNKYDEIEYISEAWKTMGVNDVAHNEAIEPEEDYMSWGGSDKKTLVKCSTSIQASKVILEPQSQEDYDKLNFFGSKSKFTTNNSYKQVKVTSNDTIKPLSFNDYDEINVEHSAKGHDKNFKSNDGQISHHFHNNEPYAIISKPKQV